MKATTIEKFVSGLCSVTEEEFTVENIFDFMAQTPVEADSLNSFLHFSPKFYTRNLIHKNELFEVMALCWDAGQASRVHNHSEQKCWMSVPAGQLRVQNFRTVECDERRRICLLEESDRFDISLAEPAKVELDEPIHQVLNVSEERAVSLHVYSKPFDTCLSYCRETNRFSEVKLYYSSINGKLCDGIIL